MTRIKTVDEAEATGAVKTFYDGLRKQRGYVPNIIKALSIKPEAMRATLNLANSVTFGSSHLSRAQEEMIAVVVSKLNNCHY